MRRIRLRELTQIVLQQACHLHGCLGHGRNGLPGNVEIGKFLRHATVPRKAGEKLDAMLRRGERRAVAFNAQSRGNLRVTFGRG